MSVLIKGMDKPTDCGLCPFEDFGYCNVKGERNTSESGVDADCPLIEAADRKTEQTDCRRCKHYATDKCKECSGYELFTDSGYVTDCSWR